MKFCIIRPSEEKPVSIIYRVSPPNRRTKAKQPKEKMDADIGQFADTLEAMQQRVSIHGASDQQDDNIDDRATHSNME